MSPELIVSVHYVLACFLLAMRAHRRAVVRYYERDPAPKAPYSSNLLLHIARFLMFAFLLAIPSQIITNLVTSLQNGTHFHILPLFR